MHGKDAMVHLNFTIQPYIDVRNTLTTLIVLVGVIPLYLNL
jgi:hypothetical protein